MKRILSLVIIFIFTAAVAEASLPARELFNVNRMAMISAAKLSLSVDSVEKLQNILAGKVEQDRISFDSAFFLKPALSPDLQRNDVNRVKMFLRIINDSKLVEGYLTGGGRFVKGSRSFGVVYSLEESVGEKINEKAGSIPGKRYYLKVMTIRAEESSGSVKGTSEFRFDIEAAQSGNTAAILDLLKKGLNVNARDDQDGRTILMHATWFGHIDVMRILIDKGADVNAKDKNGTTALILAADKSNSEIVSFLIDKGADVNAKGGNGTALMLAVNKSNAEFVGFLIDKGADVNAKDKNGTALILATDKGSAEIVSFLIDKGADVNTKDSLGYTALMKAAGRGHTSIMRILLDKGADVNTRTNDGYAALTHAAGSGHTDIVRTLIDKGADVNSKSSIGYTALMSAATSGHVAVVKVLLNKGADVNAKTSVGDTALIRASKYGHLDVANILRNAGATE